MFALRMLMLLTLAAPTLAGCGPPVPDEAPWFCAVQGSDHDDALKLMQRRSGTRTAGAARAVLGDARWRGCWGNAALVLGAAAPAGAEDLLVEAIDRVAADATSDLEADALLAGLGLTVRSTDDVARIERVVAALVERADPHWWHGRGPAVEGDGSPGTAVRARAEVRARAAVFGLAYSGTQRAARALEALRSAPPGPPTFDATPDDVFSHALRQNRRWYRQTPGSIGR